MKTIYITLGLVVLAWGIYQFWLKPNNIKSVCNEQALLSSVLKYPENQYVDTNERAKLQNEAYKNDYSACIGIHNIQ